MEGEKTCQYPTDKESTQMFFITILNMFYFWYYIFFYLMPQEQVIRPT